METRFESRHFVTGASFEIGDVTVETFSVPHDAQDPVGFLLRTRTGNIGFLTDLGHATKLVIERVRAAHLLVLLVRPQKFGYEFFLIDRSHKKPQKSAWVPAKAT